MSSTPRLGQDGGQHGGRSDYEEEVNKYLTGTVPPLRRRTLPPENTMNPADSYDNLNSLIPRVRVEFYVNENTFKERLQLYFIKNQRSSLRIRIIKMALKLVACILYIVGVVLDAGPSYATCFNCPLNRTEAAILAAQPSTSAHVSAPYSENLGQNVNFGPINWKAILWVDRDPILWTVQTLVALVCLLEALLLAYLGYKGNMLRTLLNFHFVLEIITNSPFVATLVWSPLRTLFIPGFLNCWLAKRTLENMFNDLNRVMQRSQSALSHRLMILSATLLCLIFTSVCGYQHFQRAGGKNVNLFESLYFVVVTFATVGYGDYKPDRWPSQLFMVIMICVALIVLPTQFEQLAYTWMEKQKLGGSYSAQRATTEKHVVVCSTTLRADTVMDFLNEFYAHPLLQDFYVVLLSPCELDTTMRMILQVPMWAQRVIYIQGSALKDTDLIRTRMNVAEACFILAARNYADRSAADEHTILRSWAIRDFAPNVPQYVQIFRPENKIHVAFAEHVVCEDEFKYALLANNCLCPGTSSLVTLLLHTSRGQEGQTSDESWQRLYGKCSGNEIYHIRLSDSRFFGEYEGKSFTYASFHSHRKYGVALIGVQTDMKGTWPIMLNPGPTYILKSTDICFYMNITKEENSAFLPAPNQGASVNGSQGNPTESNFQSSNAKLSVDADGVELSRSSLLKPGEPDIIRKLSSVSTSTQGDALPPKCNSMMEMLAMDSSRRRSSSIYDSNCELDKREQDRRSRRDSSPARIKRVVSGFADKAKKAISRKGGHHLDIPRLEFGLPSRDSSPSDVVSARGRRPSIAAVPAMFTEDSDHDDDEMEKNALTEEEPTKQVNLLAVGLVSASSETDEIVKGFPPVSPYVGVSPTLCYLVKEKKRSCCLLLSTPCDHCSFKNAREYNWPNRCIILAADYASNAIYNFVVPLRAHFQNVDTLRPIILLVERRPNSAFIDAISWFPMIYWMQGSIDNLDDLIKAGINLADSVVVVNKESTNSAEEDYLADCNTITAVQTMFKLFPSVRIITELSQSSNMRFMQFRAHDTYALSLSKMEKFERERGSHISYMFRLPFAAGSVFSASMLDTLLYQAFVKDYMITIVRLLLGIDQAPGSGFLSSMKIGKDDLWIRTYGRLYQKLCSTSCEIPIGIYRTQGSKTPDATTINLDFIFPILNERARYQQLSAEIERQEIGNLVKNRMQDLGFPLEDYDDVSEKRSTLSYVIINPSCDLKLEEGDVIYLIRPSPIKSKKSFLTRGNSVRASKASLRRKRTSRGSISSIPSPSVQLSPSPMIIATSADDLDDIDIGGRQVFMGNSISGAVTPVSRHPSISEADEITFTEESLRNPSRELRVGKQIEVHVSSPISHVTNDASNCQSIELNFVDEDEDLDELNKFCIDDYCEQSTELEMKQQGQLVNEQKRGLTSTELMEMPVEVDSKVIKENGLLLM
ncbi:Potassium channel subfamily T member 1 [Halotydeus destructor]|nr:Potassium channel subfamily T member 1 [Halotydeus destructor]